MRSYAAITILLLGNIACSAESDRERPDDAGFAAARDASVGDAGQAAPDGGALAPDAGQAAPDAGQAAPDAGTVDAGPPPTYTFTGDIYPMFEALGCARGECHGSLAVQGGFAYLMSDPYKAYADAVDRPSILQPLDIVAPGDPEQSAMYVHGRDANIPVGDLDQAGLAMIETWILEGAPFGPDVAVTPPPEPETCTFVGTDALVPLPSACLPRCASETWDAVLACTTSACVREALDADDTPPQSLDVVQDQVDVTCSTCADWMAQSCLADHCFSALLAAQRCQALGGACVAENQALSTCAEASPEVADCQRARLPRCAGR